MRHLLSFIIILGIISLFTSCKTGSDKSSNRQPISEINFTSLGEITEDYDSVFPTDTLSRFKDYHGVVFYVNSECSFCIASAISFLKKAITTGYSDSVIFITPTFGKPSLEFNLNKFNLNESVPYTIIEDRQRRFILDELDDYSGIFFVFNQGHSVGMYQVYSPTM